MGRHKQAHVRQKTSKDVDIVKILNDSQHINDKSAVDQEAKTSY